MRINPSDQLYIIDKENIVSDMTLENLQLAIQGGIKWNEVAVFTDKEEAESTAKAQDRRHILDLFTDAHMNEAHSVSLRDIEGNTIAARQFQTR